MIEPRHVTLIPNVLPGSCYCFDCGLICYSLTAAESHWKSQHGGGEVKGLAGIDYGSGEQLLVLQSRRRRWIDGQVGALELRLAPLVGADDLSNEILIAGPAREYEDA